ncbi:MAG: hypothetical protein QOE70_4916 [Chthoniobacter sp.]|jgi:hypothetical protein|nr:hypothetical protein [Chthoniobacter sp.]
MFRYFAALFALTLTASALTEAELDSIGRRVWKNECGGTRDGLTSWNAGENFASLGIGHFIWYSRGVNGPFEESFPKLVKFLDANGVKTPGWLTGDCPWQTLAAFQRDFRSARMNQLRDFLASTVRFQSKFLLLRAQSALPKLLKAANREQQGKISAQFARLATTSSGIFALIDYVNFKGEGTNPRERYKGEGWGLLQVLARMNGTGRGAPAEFARCAAIVLERRIRNSPPKRNEAHWLRGWKTRVQRYG